MEVTFTVPIHEVVKFISEALVLAETYDRGDINFKLLKHFKYLNDNQLSGMLTRLSKGKYAILDMEKVDGHNTYTVNEEKLAKVLLQDVELNPTPVDNLYQGIQQMVAGIQGLSLQDIGNKRDFDFVKQAEKQLNSLLSEMEGREVATLLFADDHNKQVEKDWNVTVLGTFEDTIKQLVETFTLGALYTYEELHMELEKQFVGLNNAQVEQLIKAIVWGENALFDVETHEGRGDFYVFSVDKVVRGLMYNEMSKTSTQTRKDIQEMALMNIFGRTGADVLQDLEVKVKAYPRKAVNDGAEKVVR